MSTLIPPTPAANKSAEQHQDPSEQDSFNHLLYKVLRLTSQQVQDLNGWMEHRGIPNVHEVIAQHFRKPHALEDNLKFITQGKPSYIQSNVMLSLSLMITYIRHRRYSTKSKYFGPFYYIQIDPQDYDEWRTTPPEEEIHFSGHYDEHEHQNLSSGDNQVIHQENVCSEPPEPLSYSFFQSHFQGSSTSNTQKIFLPKPIWKQPSKDHQQMIIDHNRSLPKSGSSHLSTPNKSPSLLPHLPTPQQTAKSQQVHTHQSDESTTDSIKTETTPSDPLLAMVHQSINTSDDAASDISHVLSVKRSPQIQVCQCYLLQHANHTNQQLVDCGANGGLAGSDMHVIHRTYRKINIQGIDNHEDTGLDVVTAATPLNTSQRNVIGIFNEYTYLGKGSSIHSSGQLEWFKTNVDEKSVKVGGTQLIATLDGYSVPLLIKDGLAYATSLGRPTAQDMDTYPHVFFTSPDEWDPSVLDHDPPHLDGLDPSQVPDQPFGDPMFDACGDFNKHIIANLNTLLDAPPGDCGSYTEISSVFTVNLHQSSPQEPAWNALRPVFAWTSPPSIKDTFNGTTRHGTAPHIQHYHSEPYHQHQNKDENHFGLTKLYTNTVMNTSGCPACCWLLCLQYICVVLNHLASPTLQGICPVQALEGTTPDISFMLHFSFYEPVYYRIDSSEPDFHFPSPSNEKKGYWVGFADNPGDHLTWRILTEDTQKIIICSGIRSALRTTTNQHLASPSGEGTTLPFSIPYPQQSKTSLPLDILMNQHPILSNLSTVSLVKMKIIQSTWPTLTFPIFLADPFFYHLRIMGSTTWPKSLTLMTMDNLLKTLNSS